MDVPVGAVPHAALEGGVALGGAAQQQVRLHEHLLVHGGHPTVARERDEAPVERHVVEGGREVVGTNGPGLLHRREVLLERGKLTVGGALDRHSAGADLERFPDRVDLGEVPRGERRHNGAAP